MPRTAGLSTEVAQEKVLDFIAAGMTVADAMAAVGRKTKTMENWRAKDRAYAAKVDEARALHKEALEAGRDGNLYRLDFATWRKRFLGYETYEHQQQWIDVLEGRDPLPLSGCDWEPSNLNRLIINVPPGFSKALALDTEVFTPNGFKAIADLRVGELVFGPDGKPTEIISKSEIFNKPCFKVTFKHGESFVACEDHLWPIRTPLGQGRYRDEILTTRQMFERGGLHRVPFTEALHTDEVEYTLDPYLLGVWLGDGHTACGRVTSADPEIIKNFEDAGFLVTSFATKSRARTYEISGLHPVLSELGVKGKKFVPEGYLLGSYDQRLALLQGLMDTDGTVSGNGDGSCSFTNTNRALAVAVMTLAASLGLRPSMAEGRATLNGRDCGPKWDVRFSSSGVPVFRLQRKLARLPEPTSHRGRHHRMVVSVEPVETVPTQCIEVGNDSHVFLIGRSLTPTHNSTTITVDYVTYKICMNPNVRIVIVSKRQEQARKFLHQIKQRLTSTMFAPLQAAYAPEGGFRPARGEGTYSANTIYIAGRNTDAKDPTVEVLGMGSQIYGTRADLIILDDCIVGANAHEFEKQVYWLETEVESRIKNGKILIVGTRLATRDLYAELRDGDRYLSGQTPWSYLRQPMVREFAEDPKDWVTLWPYSSTPYDEADTEPNENGLYTMFDGPTCAEIRGKKPPRVWSLVYQQQQVAEDATFHPTCVRAAINGQRKPGPLRAGAWGHPRNGREGMHVIGSIDPAGTGEAFILIYAVHRQTKERYVLNAFCANHTLPSWYADQIETLTPEYGINEWVIEQNSYASWLIHDERITAYLRGSGVKLTPHYTGRNKADPDFGVATMASLFGTLRRIQEGAGRAVHNGDNIIHLPDPITEGIRALVEQLISWQPGKLGRQLRQDGPMAMWFAETRARQVLGYGEDSRQSHFVNNPYLARRDIAKRMVVPYDTYRAQYA